MRKINTTKQPELTEADRKILRMEAKRRTLELKSKEQNKSIKYWMAEADRRGNELDVALAIKENTKPVAIKPKRGKSKSETTAVLVLSDWHVEEQVDPATINGKNAFNLEIADKRIKHLFDKALALINMWREQTNVDTLIVALLGDFITGYIHEELEEGNQLSPTEAVIWVQKRIMGGIDMLLERGKFKEIIVPCSIGNHGRTTKKPRIASAYRNNYEWLMYHNLAHAFQVKGDKRVKFVISNGYHNYIDVYGRTLRFHHGDWFNHREGIGGISVPVNKGILRWNKTKNSWLDIFGHWHQSIDGGSWISNSSLIGFNPFALKIKATYEAPSQTLLFIEKNHGKTGNLPIWLNV